MLDAKPYRQFGVDIRQHVVFMLKDNVTSCEVRVTRCVLRGACYGLRGTSCEVRVAKSGYLVFLNIEYVSWRSICEARSNKEYRTAEVSKNTSKFDIPFSVFCGSIINNRIS